MHHIAYMTPSWKLIPKIVDGQKTIESRWYKTRRSPWNIVKAGDTIYFKNSGEPVTAKAEVEKVIQYEMNNISEVRKIIKQYGKEICLVNTNPETWKNIPRYCILMFLENAKYIKPFDINKKGFGGAAAWISVKNIKEIIK